MSEFPTHLYQQAVRALRSAGAPPQVREIPANRHATANERPG